MDKSGKTKLSLKHFKVTVAAGTKEEEEWEHYSTSELLDNKQEIDLYIYEEDDDYNEEDEDEFLFPSEEEEDEIAVPSLPTTPITTTTTTYVYTDDKESDGEIKNCHQ